MTPVAGQAGGRGEIAPGLPCRFETVRLILRPLANADRPFYTGLYTDPDVMRHVGPPLSPEAAAGAFAAVRRQMRLDPPQAWYWVVAPRSGSAPAGLLAVMFDPGRESAEFGMMMPAWAHGSGYATEAVAALVALAIGGDGGAAAQGRRLQRLHTRHVQGHPAGARVMDKLGFIAGPLGQAMSHWYQDRPAGHPGGFASGARQG